MDNLQEAYLNVYEATAMAKRGLDEPAIRQQIAKKTGGGEAADRASALEKKPTYGDTNKQKQRERLGRTQRGDFRKTTSSSPGLHGYAHQSNDPEVKAKQAARGAQRSALTPNEKKQLNREEFDYNDLLKFLYFEGYAESYAEAEELLESMSDEEFEEVVEAYKEPDMVKMKRQSYKHRQQSIKQRGGGRGDAKNRSFKMDGIIDALERGEDPRRDTRGGKRTEPEDHRARFTTKQKPRPAKQPGVQKEDLEMQEAWYSGKGTYRTTASGRKVRWDEDEATDTAVSDMMQKRREAAARKAAQARMKAKGTVPKKGGKEMFESVAEYLFVEGYAASIESAEVMAENISEAWMNKIIEN